MGGEQPVSTPSQSVPVQVNPTDPPTARQAQLPVSWLKVANRVCGIKSAQQGTLTGGRPPEPLPLLLLLPALALLALCD
jgi:hypothetical protein